VHGQYEIQIIHVRKIKIIMYLAQANIEVMPDALVLTERLNVKCDFQFI
jgi:hypothetical protein